MSNIDDKSKKAPQNQKDDDGFSLVKWFVGIKSEFKRVTWSSKQEVVKMTITVITTSAVVGAIIVGFDTVITFAYDLIFG